MTVYVYSDNAQLLAELVGGVKAAGREAVALGLGSSDLVSGCGADSAVVLTGSSDRPESYAKSLAALLSERGAEALLVGSTFAGREVGALVAGYMGCPMVSDASTVEFSDSGASFSRSVYGGAVVRKEEAKGFFVASVGAAAFGKAPAADVPVEELAVEVDGRVRRVSLEPAEKGTVDLSKAKAVVSVGLGINEREDMALIEGLAEAVDGEVGCTRGIAEDRHWLPKAQYIGITGAIVSPDLFISVAASGQMQHVYGIRDSKVVVAIDTNKNAPIFRAADYGIVGDMYEVVPALTTAIKAL